MRIALLCLYLIARAVALGQLSDFPNADFHKADSVADFHQGADLQNLPRLTYQLTKDLQTEVEQFRAIYTWVSKNIDNDYRAYLKNKRKREHLHDNSTRLAKWNSKFTTKMFQTLLTDRKAVCTGYAYLVRELARLADIDCEIINGYARTATSNVHELHLPNHSWNAVELGGKWYLCDATWSSGNIHPFGDVSLFVHDYNDGYFLARPEFFFRNHYPIDTSWALLNQRNQLAAFLIAPVVYSSAFKHQLNPVAPESMKVKLTKDEALFLSFETGEKTGVNEIYIELDSGSRRRTVQPTIVSYIDGLLVIKHKFSKTGYYDLHVKIQEDFLATYVVSVSR